MSNAQFIPTASTVALYHLNGNSNDSSGAGLNGTDTSISYSLANGKFGQGSGFNGSSSQTTATAPTYGSAGTVSFWMKTNFNNTSDTNNHFIIDYSGTRCFTFAYDGSQKLFVFDSGSAAMIDPISAITANISGQWHNWICTWTGGNSEVVYYDGVSVGTGSGTMTTGTPTSLFLGCRFNSTNFYTGALCEIVFENVQWSAQKVKKYYSQTQGRFSPVASM